MEYKENPKAVYRILDANLNRTREALRVIEDLFRFDRNDFTITEKLKNIRHSLIEIESILSRQHLISARDSTTDIGKDIENPSIDLKKRGLEDTVIANFKRLEEALRCIAEYGNLIDSKIADTAEKIRFETYSIEKEFYQTLPKNRFEKVRLYLLVGTEVGISKEALPSLLAELLEAGIDAVQLREKSLSDRDLLILAEKLSALCKEKNKILIINDRPDIAELSDADGVHLGQEDLPPSYARKILSSNKIIGISTHNQKELDEAIKLNPTYIAIGPAFSSPTKPNLSPISLDFIKETIDILKKVDIPELLIGGITKDNIQILLEIGARRFAIQSGILKRPDPIRTTQTIRSMIDTYLKEKR